MSERSSSKIRLVLVAGARPNFMKVAPILRAIRERPGLEALLVHTGQHYDPAMSDAFFEDLDMPRPDVNLGVGSGTHAAQTADVLRGIEPVLIQWRPDAVVVVGDVNSTIAAALAAVKLGIPVAHVEAGLRSFDRTMPEEINRILTDAISHWLFTSEPSGAENLSREGVAPDRIHFVGNVMIDSLVLHIDRARAAAPLGHLGLQEGHYAVVTLHRPSNVDDPVRLAQLLAVLEEVHREIPIVFPIHPRTRAALTRCCPDRVPDLQLTEPMGYLQFLGLLASSRLVLTDSGGIQEETTALGVPCLTLRHSTERPITVAVGTNRLVGTDPEKLLAAVHESLREAGTAGTIPEKWDGAAAARIVEILERDLALVRGSI